MKVFIIPNDGKRHNILRAGLGQFLKVVHQYKPIAELSLPSLKVRRSHVMKQMIAVHTWQQQGAPIP